MEEETISAEESAVIEMTGTPWLVIVKPAEV